MRVQGIRGRVADRLGPGPMSTTITSTVLLQGLREPGNEAAWSEFGQWYEPLLLAFVRKAGFRCEDARDVVQETLLTFVTAFRAGKYVRARGRLRDWLRGIAFNKIREARRRLNSPEVQVVDQSGATRLLERVPDEPELTSLFDAEWKQRVLAEAFRQVRAHVETTTFEAFRLYTLQNWPAEKVAEHLGITREAVYVSKSRVLRHLRELQRETAETW